MKSRIKIALIIPLSLVFYVILKMSLPKPATNDSFREYCWVKKTHSKKRYNIVAIGDSRVYKGIDPDLLVEDNSTRDAVNLGFSSAGYSNEYLDFVSSRIKLNGTRVVVCGITPYSFTPDALINGHYHSFYDKPAKEVFKIMLLSKYLKQFPRYSPSEVYDKLSNKSIDKMYYHEFMENGWVKSYKIPSDSTFALKAYRENFIDNTFDENAFRNFVDWIEKKADEGIVVIGYRPPSTLAMENLEDSLSGFNYSEAIQQFKEKGGFWVDVNLSNYKSYDGSHLHYESAQELSRYLKEEIQKIVPN